MLRKITLALACMFAFGYAESVGDINLVKKVKIDRNLTPLAASCVQCHAQKTPGIVNDWRNSRHAHVGVSCTDCHSVEADSPVALKKEHPKDSKNHVSVLVSSKTCAKCHEKEVEEFNQSGHARGAVQMFAKKGMMELMYHYEGADHPDLKDGPATTGCIQCHGSVIKMDKDGRPTKETWPNYGIATAYPDGGVGNCVSCHSRHEFSVAESRKPEACASCHLGPDHPNIEIYNNSMHGHIYNAEGQKWNFNSAPDAWEIPDFRAPTCTTCHMAGIGDLNSTHNVSRRLRWNLWAPHSVLRDGSFDSAANEWETNMKVSVGNAKAGHPQGSNTARDEMKQVCSKCHVSSFANNFFDMADKQVELYNFYNDQAQKMFNELKEKGLLKSDEWSDEFQRIYYHSWHHEGRRMRMGALMGGPDYSHWHGVFEVQQDIRKMRDIYEKRLKTGKIED